MDQSSFDRLARVLGGATDRRAGLKAALGAIFGAGATSLAFDADAKNRKARDRKADEAEATRRRNKKKRCRPACEGGFDCVKGQCVCQTGVACGDACCLVGQACENGTCVPDPEPAACLELGEACKNVGKRCCAGLSCASGQDGSFPVACYRSKGAACAGTAECPYGMACQDGRCVGVQPPPAPAPVPDGCVPAGGACGGSSTCCEGTSCKDGSCAADPCAVTGLALGAACCTSGQCSSGLCWYPQTSDGDPDGTQQKCVRATGGACDYDTSGYAPCGLGNECDSDDNVCVGEYYPLSVPTGGTGCSDTVPCYSSSDYCNAGTCTPRTQRQIKQPCDPATDTCPANARCTTYPVGSGATDTATTYCLGDPFSYLASSATATDECASFRIFDAGNGNRCTNICAVYLTSGTADTDAARGVALKNALEGGASGPFRFFYVEPDANNVKKYETQQITLNFPATGGMNMQACYGGTQGLRYTVSGNNANRILDITTAGAVIIAECVLEKGKATAAGTDSGDGGAVRIDTTAVSGSATERAFSDCTIKNSVADGNGGGIASKGTLRLSGGMSITGCTAGAAGGGWYAETGNDQFASMANTNSITGNAASASAQGAGVYWVGTQFRQGTFSDNGAGMQCSVGSSVSINSNTGATYDCAYGPSTPTPTWQYCTCATKET